MSVCTVLVDLGSSGLTYLDVCEYYAFRIELIVAHPRPPLFPGLPCQLGMICTYWIGFAAAWPDKENRLLYLVTTSLVSARLTHSIMTAALLYVYPHVYPSRVDDVP
jgi:hypothetical protein